MQKLRQLQTIPRLNWETFLDHSCQIELNERRIEQLVDLIESHFGEVLFRLPSETGETDGVHPPLRRRILYLWKNRGEIEAARLQRE